MMNTQRLVIRRFVQTDENDFISLIRDKMASEYSNYDEQYPTGEVEIKEILDCFIKSDEFFAVAEISTARVIGFVALNAVDSETKNLGYCLNSTAQGRGYAAEAINALIAYAQKLGVKRLICGTALENTPSVKLLEKLHFQEISRGVGSFKRDSQGNPILFTACEYERLLES